MGACRAGSGRAGRPSLPRRADLLAAIPLGLAIGLAVGLLGGGGSVLAVPALVYLLDQPVSSATTTSLFVVTAGAVAGATAHSVAGRVCWRHAISFSGAALPGIVAGTFVGDAVGGDALLLALAAVMLLAARATWLRAEPEDRKSDSWESGDACPPLRLPRDLLAGVAVGFVTGLVGVGGGFLIVPTLVIALSFTMRTAVGTSLVIISATALLAAVVHLLAGREIDAGTASAMAFACAAGALGGAALTGRLPQRGLARGFAVLVTVVAAYLVLSVSVLGGPAGG